VSIPKKIHYCWLSGEEMPKNIVKYINTWKKVMPDYEVVLWDKNKFDINAVPFVKQACEIKKWAFAADYIRLYAVYTEGGIYFDTDVIALKRFDNFLEYDYFTSLEVNPTTNAFEHYENSNLDDIRRIPGFAFEAAIFGGIKGHPYLKDCLDWYETHDFILDGGGGGVFRGFNMQIAPDIYAAIAQKYGFRYKSGLQKLKCNIAVLPSEYFPCLVYAVTGNSYAVHMGVGSWFKKNTIRTKLKDICLTCTVIRNIVIKLNENREAKNST
jgi:hypothetical protein